MRHERFPEYEGAHFRVRLIVEQAVERMLERHCLAAAVRVFIKVQRQSCDSFRQDTDAGIHGSHLHGGAFCHRFTGGRAAEEKGVVASRRAVKKYPLKSLSFKMGKRKAPVRRQMLSLC